MQGGTYVRTYVHVCVVHSSCPCLQDADGRVLSDIFMVRPSRKLYPEYYLVIAQPTDLKEIRGKVSSAKVIDDKQERQWACPRACTYAACVCVYGTVLGCAQKHILL